VDRTRRAEEDFSAQGAAIGWQPGGADEAQSSRRDATPALVWRSPNTAWPTDIAATRMMMAMMIAPMNRIFAMPAVAADNPENPKNPATREIKKKISAYLSIAHPSQ
jgi:hypothetical protein